jgi:sirohydrochlorin ferrochelatase
VKSLLLVAHGSRRELSNEEVRHITTKLQQQSQHKFTHIRCAFLELATPSIPEGIDACIASGAQDITVFPYFLSAGRHVSSDIPAIIAAKQTEYPQHTIRLVAHLGVIEGISTLILANL